MPANRYTPLKENWMKIFTPIVEHLQLQIRFNLKTRNVEIKVKRAPAPAGPAYPETRRLSSQELSFCLLKGCLLNPTECLGNPILSPNQKTLTGGQSKICQLLLRRK